MFDNLKNLGGMANLLSKAGEMQEKMRQAQDNLAHRQVSADAAGGIVTAVVNGKMELVKIRIDKSKIDPSDTELLEDLVVAAVNAAHAKAADMVRDEMSKVAQSLGLPPGMIPGM